MSVKERGKLTDWENARQDAIEIDADTLLRFNEDYIGQKVFYSDVYVTQGGDNFVLVYLDTAYEYVGYLIYRNASPRVLNEDEIDFVAIVSGLYKYESTTNRMITAPLLEVVELRLSE